MRILAFLVLLTALLSNAAFAADKDGGEKVFAKILKKHWEDKEYRFDHASSEMKTSYLDLKDYVDGDVVPGTAFGAKASVIVQESLENIGNYYSDEKTISNLGETIPTFRELKVLSFSRENSKLSALADLIVKVPILPDIPVKDEIVYEKFEKYNWLRWSQSNDVGPLEWNRGYVIIEPIDSKRCLATVYAFHVLKPDKALSWTLRSAGAAFAIKHYANYLISLQHAIEKGIHSQKQVAQK